MTLREIAQRTGRTYESARLFVEGRRGPGNFPAPEVDTRTGRVWSWTAVLDWFHRNGLTAADGGSSFARELHVADLLVQIAAATTDVGPEGRARISSVLREVA